MASNGIALSTFNCRSVKSSTAEIFELCNCSDFVFLQEHWLLSSEIDMLSDIHPDFLATGISAVNISQDVLVGRPYGGTAILYKKAIASSIKHITTNDPRLTAIEFLSDAGPILLVSAYLPTDTGHAECKEDFIATCSNITALYAESEAVHMVVAGDLNCQPGSRLFLPLNDFAVENNLLLSDMCRLTDGFTYCNDSGTSTSWIDHVLCSPAIDSHVCDVEILYGFVTSDHKPLKVVFTGMFAVNSNPSSAVPQQFHMPKSIPDWSKADGANLQLYQYMLDRALCDISLPVELLVDDNITDMQHKHRLIDVYYNAITNCINTCSRAAVPKKTMGTVHTDHIVPGWNDYVEEKHTLAREAFLDWVYCGKPRQGAEFLLMKKYRASFKLALRYCRQNEERMRADTCASHLTNKDYNKFWKCINKMNNGKATKYANYVGGATGEVEIANTWCKHFQQLFNSVNDDGTRDKFYNRLMVENVSSNHSSPIVVCDVLDALQKQKFGKAIGYDGIAMEALMYGGLRLAVHICFLFNLFVKYGYVPLSFMQSVMIPLVKCKSGDLSDLNNYRAIAISTSLSKLFESVIASHFVSNDSCDMYQFGFKKGHSTTQCTNVLKRTVDYYTQRGSHVFSCFVDFTKAFDKINYWKLFIKLLDDHIDVNIVKVLAFWYCNQQVCVRWHNTVSQWFTIGNGTRQGGVLSPALFSRYIRDLLHSLVSTKVGCNLGGVFFNVLAYADDLVLLAPSWAALQQLLDVFSQRICEIDMVCNVKKTVCMLFVPSNKANIVSLSFPQFKLGSSYIQYVQKFKYLGHILDQHLSDDDDVLREVSNMFVRTNILRRKFFKCSMDVKVQLFKSYCLCFYGTALWRCYKLGSINKLKSAYNKCLKIFFGYNRRYSVSQLLLELGLPSWNTLIINSQTVFVRTQLKCVNGLISQLCMLGL